jgi:hypothetical protein
MRKNHGANANQDIADSVSVSVWLSWSDRLSEWACSRPRERSLSTLQLQFMQKE